MDVCNWLQETVGPGPPATLTLPPGHDAREEPVRQDDRTSSHQTRRCNQLFSDSSLLHVNRFDHVQGFSAHNPDHFGAPPRQSLEEDRPTAAAAAAAASSSSSSSSSSSDASDPHQQEGSDLYTRRPRRKTRPEIYEPKLGGGREKTRQRRREEKERHGKKRSRPRREAAKHKPSHHAHAFRAQNVTRDRLTMKPNRSIGLFKKGRASTPVKGRGLPDLVFSEMRFLQKHHDTGDKPQEETRNKRKRKDPTQVQEQEISAYFGAKRPPLADKDQNIQQRPLEHRSRSASLCPRSPSRTSTRLESAEPTIELPDKPYLGFGSRGVDPVALDPTYYIPWSDCVRDANHQECQRSVAELPLAQPSLRPHKQIAKAHGSVGGHPGRDPGASGESKRPQRTSQPVARAKSDRFRISWDIPHCVGRREGDSTPLVIAERSVPSISNRSTTPEHEPRLRKEPSRFNGRSDKSVLTANLEKENDVGAAKIAGKQHKPSRPIFDQALPELRVEKGQMRNGNDVSLNADSNETGRAKVPTSPRSSSPLGQLLRNCENACNESYFDTNSISLAEPVSESPLVARTDLRCQLDKVHCSSMPPRWHADAIPGRPGFSEGQWSEYGIDKIPRDGFEGGDDVDMGNCANLTGDDYAIVDFGGIRGWTGDGLEIAGARNEEDGDGLENVQGPAAEDVVARLGGGFGGEAAWVWRRHKLY